MKRVPLQYLCVFGLLVCHHLCHKKNKIARGTEKKNEKRDWHQRMAPEEEEMVV